MKMRAKGVAGLIIAALAVAGTARAAVIIGDIISVNLRADANSSTPTGAAVIGQSGDIWTQITGTGWQSAINGTYALNKTTGVASGVSMTFAGGARAHGNASAANLDIFESGFYLEVVSDPATVTFSGFTPGTQIDLYLYSGGWNTGEGATFTFNSSSLTTINTVDIETAYTLGNNYVKFSGLVADGAGNIAGTWTKPGQTTEEYSIFNGAQIAVIPEPGSLGMLGAAVIAMLLRRKIHG